MYICIYRYKYLNMQIYFQNEWNLYVWCPNAALDSELKKTTLTHSLQYIIHSKRQYLIGGID